MIKFPSRLSMMFSRNKDENIILNIVSRYDDLDRPYKAMKAAQDYLNKKIDYIEFKKQYPDNDSFSDAVQGAKDYHHCYTRESFENLQELNKKAANEAENDYRDFKERMFKDILNNEYCGKKDIIRCALNYAESVLPFFEKEFQSDKRHRHSIEAANYFLNGIIDKEKLEKAFESSYKADEDTRNYYYNTYNNFWKIRTGIISEIEAKFYFSSRSIKLAVLSALSDDYLETAARAVWNATLINDSIKVEAALGCQYYDHLMKR